MGELFNRTFALNLGGVRVASETVDGAQNQILRVVFQVTRDLSKEPNTAEVAVYNLREQTRALVSEKAIATTIEAGYSGRSSVIFAGQLEYGRTMREGPDWVTTFESTDSAKPVREARINLSFQPGVGVQEVLQRAAGALGVGIGNALEKAAGGNVRGALQEFGNGIVLSGTARGQFDKIVQMMGLEWSIQDGQIQILEPGEAIDAADAIVLSPTTGLIGSPETGEDGAITVKALLIPSLTPGRVVEIRSRQVEGFHTVDRVVFSGDTRGQNWYAEIEVEPR